MRMGDKIRRRMEALGINQSRLSELSGISQGIISQLINGKQQSVSPDNLRRLSDALRVPVVYWLTDSVKEFVASRLAGRGQGELSGWEEWPPHVRIRWVMEDIDACWGREMGFDALVHLSRVSEDSLNLMLEGRLNVTAHVLRSVACLTGLPEVVFTGEQVTQPDGLPQRYIDLAETAYTLGLDPNYVTEMLVLLSRRPPATPPEAHTRKQKGPGG